MRLPATSIIALTAIMALAGCVHDDPAPTPTATIDDTFVIVTVTPRPASRPTPTLEGTRIYVVEEGDTVSSIAAQFGVSEEEIIQLNGLDDPDDIKVGQVLYLPPADLATMAHALIHPILSPTLRTRTGQSSVHRKIDNSGY